MCVSFVVSAFSLFLFFHDIDYPEQWNTDDEQEKIFLFDMS